jgi:hypothetical protein
MPKKARIMAMLGSRTLTIGNTLGEETTIDLSKMPRDGNTISFAPNGQQPFFSTRDQIRQAPNGGLVLGSQTNFGASRVAIKSQQVDLNPRSKAS